MRRLLRRLCNAIGGRHSPSVNPALSDIGPGLSAGLADPLDSDGAWRREAMVAQRGKGEIVQL